MTSAEQDQEYVEYVTARLPALRRLAYFLCGDEHRADDLVQQTLTSLYVHWRRVRGMSNIDGYVHRILVRAHLNERRLAWSSRVRLLGAAPEVPTRASSVVEDRMVLLVALGRLPPRQRAVLVLRFLYDQPIEAVAEVLGCRPGTVKSQASRGLATLRDLLAPRRTPLRHASRPSERGVPVNGGGEAR